MQLAAPRSTEGVTDNQHGERERARERERSEEEEEEEERQKHKRGEGVCIRRGRMGGGRGKRWSLPKWVVMPHLSIPCCHTPSPTPQEF